MFIPSVNMACINGLFTADTIPGMGEKAIHEQMRRVYEAAAEARVLDQARPQTSLAARLNVSPQSVNNWEKRGPSCEALLHIQQTLNINASWIVAGSGPMFVGDGWPFKRVPHAAWHGLSAEDRAYLEGTISEAIRSLTEQSATRQPDRRKANGA